MDEIPVFRALKKRKPERQKLAPSPANEARSVDVDSDEIKNISAAHARNLEQSMEDQSDDEENNVSSLIKSRRQKARHGIAFANTISSRMDQSTDISTALVKAAPDEDPLKDISTRFTTSTGQVVDVDQHMIEYIDSQMAHRKRSTADAHDTRLKHGRVLSSSQDYHRNEASDDDNIDDGIHDAEGNAVPRKDILASQANTSTVPTHNQPSHLAEVSLANMPSPSTQKPQLQPTRPRKPKLGRDGKPFKPRPRKRANSADQARDRLVEQILAENKLDSTYTAIDPGTNDNKSHTPADPSTAGTNEDADEKMAAEFRREFLEGVAERRARVQQHPSGPTAKKSAAGGVSDGPKLGGSRSARAKMQAALMADKDKGGQGKK